MFLKNMPADDVTDTALVTVWNWEVEFNVLNTNQQNYRPGDNTGRQYDFILCFHIPVFAAF